MMQSLLNPLSKMINEFLTENPKQPKNEKQYREAVQSFITAVGDLDISEIKSTEYQKYKTWMLENKSYETARTRINYLHIVYNWFIKLDKYPIKENPFVKLKRRDKKNITTIPQEHWDKILPALKKEDNIEFYNYINFLKLTGFRKQEALKLTWDKVDLKKQLITVTNYKDNLSEDLFPLNLNGGELLKFLQELIKTKTDNNIFHINENYVIKKFQKILKALNLPKYTLHDIRRTFGSYWATKINQIQLMKLMRHAEIQTTLKYYIDIDVLSIAPIKSVTKKVTKKKTE